MHSIGNTLQDHYRTSDKLQFEFCNATEICCDVRVTILNIYNDAVCLHFGGKIFHISLVQCPNIVSQPLGYQASSLAL